MAPECWLGPALIPPCCLGDTANLPVTQVGSLIAVPQLASWPKASAGAVPLTYTLDVLGACALSVSVSPSLSLSCACRYFSVSVSLSISLCFSNSVVFLLGVLKTQTSDVAAPRARDLREASAADWPLSSEPQKSHKATETPHRLKGTEHRPHFLSGGLSKNLWACFKTTRLGTSLAVRWLRLCLPAQRVGVRSLVGESKIPRTS